MGQAPSSDAPDRGLKLRVHEACWFPPNSDFFSVDFHKTSHLFTSDILQVTRYVHCYFHWCKRTHILHCSCSPRKHLMRPPYVSICQHLACVSMKSDKSRSTQSRQRKSTKKYQRIQNSPSLSMRLPPTLEISTPNELRILWTFAFLKGTAMHTLQHVMMNNRRWRPQPWRDRSFLAWHRDNETNETQVLQRNMRKQNVFEPSEQTRERLEQGRTKVGTPQMTTACHKIHKWLSWTRIPNCRTSARTWLHHLLIACITLPSCALTPSASVRLVFSLRSLDTSWVRFASLYSPYFKSRELAWKISARIWSLKMTGYTTSNMSNWQNALRVRMSSSNLASVDCLDLGVSESCYAQTSAFNNRETVWPAWTLQVKRPLDVLFHINPPRAVSAIQVLQNLQNFKLIQSNKMRSCPGASVPTRDHRCVLDQAARPAKDQKDHPVARPRFRQSTFEMRSHGHGEICMVWHGMVRYGMVCVYIYMCVCLYWYWYWYWWWWWWWWWWYINMQCM